MENSEKIRFSDKISVQADMCIVFDMFYFARYGQDAEERSCTPAVGPHLRRQLFRTAFVTSSERGGFSPEREGLSNELIAGICQKY